MKIKKKYLWAALVIYALLLFFNSFYIFNGAFEWASAINPFNNFYAFIILLIVIVILLVKRFGSKAKGIENINSISQETENTNAQISAMPSEALGQSSRVGLVEYLSAIVGILLILVGTIIGQSDALAAISLFIIPLISIALFIPMLRKRKGIGIALMVLIYPMMFVFLSIICLFNEMTYCPF